MNKFLVSAVAAAVISVSGCATIISGSNQTVVIKSVPDSAAISISDKSGQKIHSGTTPATVVLRRGSGFFKPAKYDVTFSKDGFQTKTVTITAKLNGWYVGNIIFGGVLGLLIIDPATGAMYSLSPDNVDTVLDANAATTTFNKADRSLTVMLVQDVPAAAMKQAQYLGTM